MTFFRWSLMLVKVPPYESGVKMPNFQFSWLNGEFLLGQKCSPHFLNQNEELSKKIGACICIYTRVYANTWQGGPIRPPPALNRVKTIRSSHFLLFWLPTIWLRVPFWLDTNWWTIKTIRIRSTVFAKSDISKDVKWLDNHLKMHYMLEKNQLEIGI